MKMRCILADDEPLARKGIENFIKEIPFLELTDSCNSALQVMDALANNKTDLLFLDIQMPKMTGLDFLKSTSGAPITIITTAYPSYAIESFELSVIDYLLKPIPFERFVKAVNKAKDYFDMQQSSLHNKEQEYDYCYIKCDKAYEKIPFSDLLYIEAFVNYVVIHTKTRKFISYLTLKAVEDQLPGSLFLKINKSYLVSLTHIERIEGSEVVIGNMRLPISRTIKDQVMETILNNRLLKR